MILDLALVLLIAGEVGPVPAAHDGPPGPVPPTSPEAEHGDDKADAYRTPVDALAEEMIGSASRAVRFDWRRSPVAVGGAVGELLERNNFGSDRFGPFVRKAFGDITGELGVHYVRTTSTTSSDLLALTPYRQAARPSRLEIDVDASYAVAEGVVTPLPAILPAAEMVFSGTAGARYLVYPQSFGGIALDQLGLDLASPKLSTAELNNLESSRLGGMSIDTGRYEVLAGATLDVYFQPGVFVSPRVLVNLPVVSAVSGSQLGFWWETTIAVGYSF